MNPKVTIVVPIYNVEKTLARCLDSIINQTLQDIEIILINDGSTDKSGDICAQYAAIDNRIQVIHQPNGGQAQARNRGIIQATSEYIGFVDSDDWVDSQMYQAMYEQAQASKSEIVACNFWRITPKKSYLQYSGKHQTIEYNREQAMAEIFNNSVLTFSVWNKIYRRELFDNISFLEGMIFEDIDISYRLIQAARKISYLNKPFYSYEYNNTSTIRSGFSLKQLDEQKALSGMYEFYKNNYPHLAELVYFQLFWSTIINYTLIKIWYKKELDKYQYLLKFDRHLLWGLTINRKLSFIKRIKVFGCLLLPDYGTALLAITYKLKHIRG